MDFEAHHLKQTFSIGIAFLLTGCVAVTLFCLSVLWASVLGVQLIRADSVLSLVFLVGAAVILLLVNGGGFFLIRRLMSLQKDAEKYDLTIKDKTLYLLCDGEDIRLEVCDVRFFFLLPKSSAAAEDRSRWTETAVIRTEREEYRICYLTNIRQAKAVFDRLKAENG